MYQFDGYQQYLEQYEQYMKFLMSDTVSDILSVVIALAFSVVSYIFQGRAMYAVAQRRGIEKPWLAWVPVGNAWLMGCISDQYRYVTMGQVKNRRKILMALDVGQIVATFAFCGVVVALALNGVNLLSGDLGDVSTIGAVSGMMGLLTVSFVTVAVSLAYMLFYYLSLWDFFRSCNPQKYRLFFLLSVLLLYPQPFLMFSCRNKDDGMPPRREALPDIVDAEE